MVAFTSIISTVSVIALVSAAPFPQATVPDVSPPVAATVISTGAAGLAAIDSAGASTAAALTPVAKRQEVNAANTAVTTTLNTLNGNSVSPNVAPAPARMARQLSPANSAIVGSAGSTVVAAANVQAAQAQAVAAGL